MGVRHDIFIQAEQQAMNVDQMKKVMDEQHIKEMRENRIVRLKQKQEILEQIGQMIQENKDGEKKNKEVKRLRQGKRIRVRKL